MRENYRHGAEEHAAAWQIITVTEVVRINDELQRDFRHAGTRGSFPRPARVRLFRLGHQGPKGRQRSLPAVAALAPGGIEPDIDWPNTTTGYKLVKSAPHSPERGLSQPAAAGDANDARTSTAADPANTLRVETTRAPMNSAGAGASAGNQQKPIVVNKKMKTVCTWLGLSAEADEQSGNAAVTKLLNRGDITPDDLALLKNHALTINPSTHQSVWPASPM
jgi:hypothetical protein